MLYPIELGVHDRIELLSLRSPRADPLKPTQGDSLTIPGEAANPSSQKRKPPIFRTNPQTILPSHSRTAPDLSSVTSVGSRAGPAAQTNPITKEACADYHQNRNRIPVKIPSISNPPISK